jgi:hypothetical protein
LQAETPECMRVISRKKSHIWKKSHNLEWGPGKLAI